MEVARKQSTLNFPRKQTCTRTYAYQRVRNVFSREIWSALFSWYPRFEMRPFALLPTSYIQHLHSLSFFDYRLISVDVTINDSWKAASNIGLTESKKKKWLCKFSQRTRGKIKSVAITRSLDSFKIKLLPKTTFN